MSYLKLAHQLLRDYVVDNISSDVDDVVSTAQHVQWRAGEFTVTLSETSPTTSVINFIRETKVDGFSVDWVEFGADVDAEVTDELRARFSILVNQALQGPLKPLGKSPGQENTEKTQTLDVSPPSLLAGPETGPEIPGKYRRPPDMPDFDDEYDLLRRRDAPSTRAFPAIGDRDLDPAGVSRYPPMKPYLDPLAEPNLGMYPTKDHPIFGGGRGRGGPPGVPPGARYDDPFGGSGGSGFPGSGFPGPGAPF